MTVVRIVRRPTIAITPPAPKLQQSYVENVDPFDPLLHGELVLRLRDEWGLMCALEQMTHGRIFKIRQTGSH